MTNNENSTTKTPILNNKAYDVAKDATTIWLPAAATLYAALAAIWHLPFSVEVVGTIGALVVFLGVVLKISSNRFNNQPVEYNGTLLVNRNDPLQDTHKLEIDAPWDELGKLNEVRIQVVDTTVPDPLHTNGKD